MALARPAEAMERGARKERVFRGWVSEAEGKGDRAGRRRTLQVHPSLAQYLQHGTRSAVAPEPALHRGKTLSDGAQ